VPEQPFAFSAILASPALHFGVAFVRHRKIVPAGKQGVIRPLDPDDPRNIDHPSHREQWLELARAIGRLEAREEFNLLQGVKSNDQASETAKDGRTVRPVLKRHAKGSFD
jgi:hypothetical protein